ncbi:DNA invertase Pin-like site-specific DNA recombinase, partial [Rhizobium sp. SG_E_25_P2]|uniref:recombinase family protein n=1 Tax=Rhizobium sp. SG_E_25_P2 TaxID=2879942 RepID=UPI00247522F7
MTQDHPRPGTRAYSYVRMSTHKQLSGDSLRRQLEKSRSFAKEHGLRLDEGLSDIGVSAWKGKNA